MPKDSSSLKTLKDRLLRQETLAIDTYNSVKSFRQFADIDRLLSLNQTDHISSLRFFKNAFSRNDFTKSPDAMRAQISRNIRSDVHSADLDRQKTRLFRSLTKLERRIVDTLGKLLEDNDLDRDIKMRIMLESIPKQQELIARLKTILLRAELN